MANDILTTLGSHIRSLRIAKNMTQQELAEKSELSLPFINLIENNKRNVSLETLVKLLETLDTSLSDFFLPFSNQEDDNTLKVLLLLIQQSPDKEKYIRLFTDILILAK